MVKLSRAAQLVSGRGRVACTRWEEPAARLAIPAAASTYPIHSGSNGNPPSERETDEEAVEGTAGEE